MRKKAAPPSVTSVLFCGVGGQGVLKASEVCAVAAMRTGLHVKKSEVKGMSQRGGSVDSHVRFGRRVFSPLIPAGGADFLVPFDGEEGKRWTRYLKKGGVDLKPFLDGAVSEAADRRFVNVYMLGVLSAFLPFSEKIWLRAVGEVLRKAADENRRAFLYGRKKGKTS